MKTSMNLIQEIRKQAAAIGPTLIAIRRDLHQHPEIGFQEHRTCRQITARLRALALDQLRSPVGGTGVVGLLKGGQPGRKTAALRADIDALPVVEAGNPPYKSRIAGVMHACGHDGHVAMVLGAAMILKRLQAQIPGAVKFIFQPAEEGLGGAEAMIRAGALRAPRVDAIFGIHVSVSQPYGTAGISPGPIMAAADRFHVKVIGRGGHGAHPEHCADPLLAANRLYQEFNAIGHALKGYDARVISICAMHGGTAFNIIPDSCELLGTVRTLDRRVQDTIIRRMRRIIRGIQLTHGVRCEFDYLKGYPVTANDAALAALARAAATDLEIPVRDYVVTMGAEDFSMYLETAPGAYIDIGIRKNRRQPGFHNNRFDFDDRILARGAALLARCALRFLDA
jgi:amidohydrolase